MKQILVGFLLLVAVSETLAAAYSDTYSNSYALVVGVDRYSLWPQLEYASKDAREIAALLERQGFKVDLLLDARATKSNLLQHLRRLGEIADRDSRIVFYFAGHGQTEDVPSGAERGYLVPVDADLYEWDSTMLPMQEVNRLIRTFDAKHIFLAFDSCYSGLGLMRGIKISKTDQEPGYIQKMLGLQSIQVLTAGGRAEQAIEVNGHGLFTDHLLAALSGSADINSDGYVTGTEVYALVRPSVTKKSFNRQTPQFGYLRGEGDFIFKLPEKPKAGQSTLVLDTAVKGVDVWVDTEEVASRISSEGVHSFRVVSGWHRVLVKKGGQTLFSDTVLLAEGGEYRLKVSSAPQPSNRAAYSMYSIVSKSIVDFSQSLPYDLDGDGHEEIVTSAKNQLFIHNRKGELTVSKTFDYPVRLDLVKRWQGKPAIAVSGKTHDRVILSLFDQQLNLLWRNERRITKVYQGKPDGGGSIAEIADINGDRKEEVIAFSSAGYAWKPRGVIVYDSRGSEMWRYLVGPFSTSIVVWKKRTGDADLIIGTYSPGNGNRERHNNTDDQHSYLVSINSRGRTNWVIEVGTHYTGSKPFLADVNGDGDEQLYAYKWTAYDYRTDEGAVYRISRGGQILSSFQQRDSIKSLVAMTALPGQAAALFASDKNGNLLKLDGNLNLLKKRTMNVESAPLIINLVGVHDYDGDSKPELLLYSFNRLQQGNNPRSDSGPRNTIHFSNMKYQVLSSDLQEIERETLVAEGWDQWRGFKIVDFERPEMSRFPFMVLSDKISLFNF